MFLQNIVLRFYLREHASQLASWLIVVGVNVQDNWGSADHSGIVPSPVGEKRREEVCTGKTCDSAHSGVREQQGNKPHQVIPYSASPSILVRECLTPKFLTFFYEELCLQKEEKVPPLYLKAWACMIFFFFSFQLFLVTFVREYYSKETCLGDEHDDHCYLRGRRD